MAAQIATDSIPCPICHYPIQAPTQEGQQAKCPWCSTINEAITQSTVTLPTAILIAVFSFIGGAVVGHAAMISLRGGSEYLAAKAEKRFGRK